MVAVVLAVVLAFASFTSAATTPRRALSYGPTENYNSALDRIDSTLPFATTTGVVLLFCGQSFNTTTGFIGPAVSAFFGRTNPLMGDGTCDALDSATETTADNPINAAWPSTRVLAMRCSVSSDPASDVVFTARTGAADLSPTLTCTVAGTGTGQDCFTKVDGAAPTIPAGGAIAVKVVTLEDLSAQDASCFWTIQY